jgi:LPS-assembly lipoprotein
MSSSERRLLLAGALTLASSALPAAASSCAGRRHAVVPQHRADRLRAALAAGRGTAEALERSVTVEDNPARPKWCCKPWPTCASARGGHHRGGAGARGAAARALRFRTHTPAGREVTPPAELSLSRDMSYSESIALAKQHEEAELYREMQTDIVAQVLRRLAAIRL